jgi:hypothetical protein
LVIHSSNNPKPVALNEEYHSDGILRVNKLLSTFAASDKPTLAVNDNHYIPYFGALLN